MQGSVNLGFRLRRFDSHPESPKPVFRAEAFRLRLNPDSLNCHCRTKTCKTSTLQPQGPKPETGAQGRVEYVQCWQIDTAKARLHAANLFMFSLLLLL